MTETEPADPRGALIAAATRLADTLAQENAALAALDMPRAVAMLPAKLAATEAFTAAQAALHAAPRRPPLSPARLREAAVLTRALVAAAHENRRLLARAIAVQGRVISIIARAARAAAAPPVGYGAAGTLLQTTRPAAVALTARA